MHDKQRSWRDEEYQYPRTYEIKCNIHTYDRSKIYASQITQISNWHARSKDSDLEYQIRIASAHTCVLTIWILRISRVQKHVQIVIVYGLAVDKHVLLANFLKDCYD